jgi:hypothetical protein
LGLRGIPAARANAALLSIRINTACCGLRSPLDDSYWNDMILVPTN